MPRDVVEVDNEVVVYLKQAKARIADPEKWTRKALYRGHNGRPLGHNYMAGSANSDKITSMCMMGTLQWTFGKCQIDAHMAVLAAIGGALTVPHFNDSYNTTHADVLAAFDRAIEYAEQMYR